MMPYICYSDAFIMNDDVVFSNLKFNALMKTNLISGKTEIIDYFPQVNRMDRNLHLRVFNDEHQLIFIPYSGQYIQVYDFEKKQWGKTIEILNEVTSYVYAEKIENEVWIFPKNLKNPIIIYDVKTKSVNHKKIWIETAYIGSNDSLDCFVVLRKGNCFLLAVYGTNLIIKISIVQKKIIKKFELSLPLHINSINLKSDHEIWITCENSSDIWIWNYTDDTFKVYKTEVEHLVHRVPFSQVINVNDSRALVLPYHTDDIYCLDIKTGSMKKLPMPLGYKRCRASSLFCFVKNWKENLLLFPYGGNDLLMIDKNFQISGIEAIYDKNIMESCERIIKEQFEYEIKNSMLWEYDGWTERLPFFLDYIVNNSNEMAIKKGKTYGIQIHQTIKKTENSN